MESHCYFCSTQLTFPNIRRYRLEQATMMEIDCPNCGSYLLDEGTQAVIQNLRNNKILQEEEIKIIKNWIKNNIGRLLSKNVLFNLLPKQIKLFEEKYGIKFSRDNANN